LRRADAVVLSGGERRFPMAKKKATKGKIKTTKGC
jgi:hypothetical protein